MSPQRRRLVSVGAAVALVALKLTVGLASHSLGLISEAIHSGTDLVAALLTFFAVGVAAQPADRSHQYGHGKAEHLAALAEAAFLALASVFIGVRAIERLTGSGTHTVDVTWWVLAVALARDRDRRRAGRPISWRASRRYRSAALASNALHFGSDLAGSVAVLVGLLLARAGYPNGDSIAALFVAALVLAAAARLIRRNIDVLMDRAPADAEEAARAAIAEVDAGRRAAAAADAPGRRPPVRGRRDRRLVDRGRRPGSRRRRRGRGGGRARAAGQRRRRPRRAARGPGRPRARARGGADRARACARSTTSRSSTSTAGSSCRCTSSCRAR